MKKVLIVLALVTAVAFAVESYPVEGSGSGGTGSDDLLQYDDGTAQWLWSGISYFGTWFDITDFLPGAAAFDCDFTEWWFYHHENHPWDTDQISVELWTGDVVMPVTQLAQNDITALHYAPVVVNYSTPVSTGADFWMIANTTVFSALGIPSQLYDDATNFTGIAHSFYSQDWILWDPLISSTTGNEINALSRADGTLPLESDSWGSIKGLFR